MMADNSPLDLSKVALSCDFFRGSRSGILSTHSLDVEGYPFGSLVPYCPLPDGSFVILISSLAQHTRNIKANSKVSLTIADNMPEIQAGRRLTIMADATLLEDADLIKKSRERYLRFFPESLSYFSMHDFSFYRVQFCKARHIGGFGNIFWIEKNEWASEFSGFIEGEGEACKHMNSDHKSFLSTWANKMKMQSPTSAIVAGIDPEGFYLKCEHEQAFIRFTNKATDLQGLRMAFKNLSLV